MNVRTPPSSWSALDVNAIHVDQCYPIRHHCEWLNIAKGENRWASGTLVNLRLGRQIWKTGGNLKSWGIVPPVCLYVNKLTGPGRDAARTNPQWDIEVGPMCRVG